MGQDVADRPGDFAVSRRARQHRRQTQRPLHGDADQAGPTESGRGGRLDDREAGGSISFGDILGPAEAVQQRQDHGLIGRPLRLIRPGLQFLAQQGPQLETDIAALAERQTTHDVVHVAFDHGVRVHGHPFPSSRRFITAFRLRQLAVRS